MLCCQGYDFSRFFQWSYMDVRAGLWRKLSTKELVLLNCGVGEDSGESLGLQGHPTSPFWRRSVLGVHWKDWCWSWNSNTLATSCEVLTHWKRLSDSGRDCGAGGEGDNRGWDGWMASPTWWTWVWVNSERWWWTGRPGMLRFMGSPRVGHRWVTELNWTYIMDYLLFLHDTVFQMKGEGNAKFLSKLISTLMNVRSQVNFPNK